MSVSKPLTVALLASVIVTVASAPASAQATWTVVPTPNTNAGNLLFGAAASDASHVWAVGQVVDYSTNPATGRSLLLRYDGTAWRPVTVPAFPRTNALYEVDAPAANDAWAVGSREVDYGRSATLVEHWDGGAWSTVLTPNANANGYNSLAGTKAVPGAAGSVWAVGTYTDPQSLTSQRFLILQRSGSAWRVVPAPRVTSSDTLEAVDATGPSDAWAVGWGSNGPYGAPTTGVVLRWNGTSWRSLTIPNPGPTVLSAVEAIAPNNVWVVGETYPGGAHWVPFVLHFDGTSWSRVPVPALPFGGDLDDVVASSPTNIYAVGHGGDTGTIDALVLRWDGRAWTREPTPSPAYAPF
jgi:hypothetical protein